MSSSPDTNRPPRLTPSLALLCLALVAAFIFSAAFETAPQRPSNPMCGTVADSKDPAAIKEDPTDAHAGHGGGDDAGTQTQDQAPEETGPQYFGGGLWSEKLGLSALSEVVASVKATDGRVVAQSVSWNDGQLVVLDRSPIDLRFDRDSKPAMVLVSVDHHGPDPTPEFATAVQKHIDGIEDATQIVAIAPLPGPDQRPDSEFPYDWTFLMIKDNVDIVDWTLIEPQPDLPGFPKSGYLRAWLGKPSGSGADLSSKTAYELMTDVNVANDPSVKGVLYFELIRRGPYEVIPALGKALIKDTASPESTAPSDQGLSVALLVHRLLGVHADQRISLAMQSEDPRLRRAAARAIGELTDATRDPIGRLTRLAEDKDMAVRREALSACYRIGGRRAAGVAQLVEAYEMSDAMRATYEAIMPTLLVAGEPIQPDSRAARLRRMPIDELLSEERDPLVCKVLLEREDLPDSRVKPIVNQLGELSDQPPLGALIDLLADMNPQVLSQREPLLQTLATWEADQREQMTARLMELTAFGKPLPLRHAAGAALIGALPRQRALNLAIPPEVRFPALARVDDDAKLRSWADTVLTFAFADDNDAADRVHAIDAIKHLPADSIDAQNVDRLLGMARTAENVPMRFAAIRAINALPDALQPDDMADLALTRLTLRAVPGEVRYDKATLTATAGRPVEITLVNPDTMPHNLVITRPGQGQAIGMQVTNMPPNESAAIDYVPQSADILHHTVMVPAGASDTLRFIAPAKPGSYDYVCTFPGHFTTMYGTLQVVAPQ